MTSHKLPVPQNIFNDENIKQEFSELGLDGLSLSYQSFPTITLQGKSFIMSDDESFSPKSFNVVVMQTIRKYILVDADDPNYDGIKYSRDEIHTVDGEPLDVYMDSMRHDGRNPQLKRYLDVLVQLKTDDQHHDKLAVLSISPTSVDLIWGFFFQLRLQGKISQLNQLLIKVAKGQLRSSKGGQNYHLWSFSLIDHMAIAA